jgi:hypothetical protein
MKILICICSKYPNHLLYSCIHELYKIQINNEKNANAHTYEIHVVDSDSSDTVHYDKVTTAFPEVKIHYIKNKNYEYGAWKYISENYPGRDIYFCIQDTITIKKYIDLSLVTDNNAYTFHHHSGYNSDIPIKSRGINILKDSKLNYTNIISSDFNLAQHSSFIVSNNIIKDIFNFLTMPAIDKIDSRCYERNFGIYFIDKSINTINLYDFMDKINGGRN